MSGHLYWCAVFYSRADPCSCGHHEDVAASARDHPMTGDLTETLTAHVDRLAAEIRRVDGNHDMGAGLLAEALMPLLAALVAAERETAARIAWDEACRALAWCLENGPAESAPAYVAGTNPYAATEGGDR